VLYLKLARKKVIIKFVTINNLKLSVQGNQPLLLLIKNS